MANKRSIAQTPAPKKDRIYGSKVNPKGSASSEKSAKSIKLSSDIILSLTKKLKEFKETHSTKKVSLSDLKAVYRRGLGAYSSTHRPTISGGKPNTRNAWAMARVNAFLRKAGGGEAKKSYVQDDDLLKFKEGGLLAPNGKPTNLTPKQYKLVRTPEFKAWFGDWENDPQNASKVIDENGEPLVVYHGTDKYFNIFDKKRAGELETIKEVDRKIGIYFSNKKQISKFYTKNKGQILEVFLNLRNPIKTKQDELTTFYIKFYQELGNDGLIWNRGSGVKIDGKPYPLQKGEIPEIEYIVFESNQIKLADGTNTTFDGSNPDIRYSKGGVAIFGEPETFYERTYADGTKQRFSVEEYEKNIYPYLEKGGLLAPNGKPSNLTPEQYKLVRTPEFKDWFGDWENNPESASKVVDENGEPLVVYHFSDLDFNVFEIKGISKGFFFTENKNDDEFSYDGIIQSLDSGKIPRWLKKYSVTEEEIRENIKETKYKKTKSFFLNIKKINKSIVPDIYWSVPTFENPRILKSKYDYFDGIEFINEIDEKRIIVAFESEQIKLADGSNTTFDGSNPDIRYDDGGGVDYNDKELLKKYNSGKNIGFTAISHLKAKGLIPRVYGNKIKSDKYKKLGGEVDEHKETYQKWKSLVNMSYSELKRFYDSEEGKVAGLKPSEAKAQGIDSGRESARWIMKMKKTPVSEWTPQMWKWANKQISFISRMSGGRGELYDEKGNKTRKYLSLLIWGNDPKKKNNGGMIKYNIKVSEGLSDETIKQMLQSSLEKLKYYKDRGYTKERLIKSKKFTKSWLDKYYEDGGTINQSINTNIMDEIKFNQLPHIDTISNNDNVLIRESVFAGNLDKPKHIGERYIHCQVMGEGGMINSLNLKVVNSVGANALRVGEVISRPITNVLTRGRKLIVEPIANAMPKFKEGGLNPDNKEVKQYFAHDSGNAGGVLVGKRHSEGGIKAINKGTGQPLEMEGGEVVITRGAVSNPKKYQFQNKEMTTREILSKLNVDGGGVSFAEGGDVPDKINCGCDKMDFGGTTMSIQDFVNRSDSEYQEHRLKAGIQKERNDHYDTLSKLNAGTITIDQTLREIAQKEMKLDSKYPFAE
jgi:hypothetical protein